MKFVLAALLLFTAVAALVWFGLTIRDTLGRGTGSRREQLVMTQRFAVMSVLGLGGLVSGLWLLEFAVWRFWWLFALAAVQIPALIIATARLRRDDEDR